MSNSSSTSNLHFRERKRVPIACTNCRAVKLKCRPIDPVDNVPCERCVIRKLLCEYRPVEQGPISNSQPHQNFPIHDDLPVNLYPVPSAPPGDQSNWFQSYVPSPTSGEYAPYHPYCASAQAPFQTNLPSYATPQYQQTMPPSSYPMTYHAGQPSYQPPPQSDGQPSNQLPYYAGAYPSYDYRGQPFYHYENQMNDPKPAKE